MKTVPGLVLIYLNYIIQTKKLKRVLVINTTLYSKQPSNQTIRSEQCLKTQVVFDIIQTCFYKNTKGWRV